MVTLKDIACKANCSVSLVSRVLNPKASKTVRVADDTRQLIEKVAFELGFKQNLSAQFLRQGKTPAIGIFLPRKSNRLISDLVIGLSTEASKHDFPINIFFGQDCKCYVEFINKNKQVSSTGIITYPYLLLDSPDLIAREIKGYCASGGKALLLNNFNSISLPNVPSVDIDDNHGARIATEHLLERKCDKYLLCYEPEVREDGYIERRINGYSQVMHDAGLIPEIVKLSEIDSCLCQPHNLKIGVFCLTDSCGLKLIKMAEEAKWNVGKNFMVVGFDNLYLTEIIKPRLTTLHQPFEEMGRIAMNKIINMILFGIAEKSTTIVPSLIKGETT